MSGSTIRVGGYDIPLSVALLVLSIAVHSGVVLNSLSNMEDNLVRVEKELAKHKSAIGHRGLHNRFVAVESKIEQLEEQLDKQGESIDKLEDKIVEKYKERTSGTSFDTIDTH